MFGWRRTVHCLQWQGIQQPSTEHLSTEDKGRPRQEQTESHPKREQNCQNVFNEAKNAKLASKARDRITEGS